MNLKEKAQEMGFDRLRSNPAKPIKKKYLKIIKKAQTKCSQKNNH